MSLSTIVVQGTLRPDGTLELDEKPTIAPAACTSHSTCFCRNTTKRRFGRDD